MWKRLKESELIKRHGFKVVVVGILVLFLLAENLEVDPFYSFSLRFFDIYFRFHHDRPSESVVFVLVDEKSVNRFGRWPWDRKVFAQGLKKLRKAKVVVLDIVFSEPTNPDSDRVLAQTIAELGNVICGFFVRLESTEEVPEEVLDIMMDSALSRVPEVIPFEEAFFVEPNILPVTESCLLLGVFNAKADKDNIFRHYPLGFVFQNDFYPSLAVQALRAFLRQDAYITEDGRFFIGEKEVPVDSTRMALLNYYSFESYLPFKHSFVDVYEGKIPEEAFEGKIVIVGISEAGVTDIRSTPIGQIPGPLLHFTFVSNYLKDELLRSSKLLNSFVLLVVFALVGLVHLKVDSPYARGLFYGAIFVVVFLVSFSAYHFLNFKLDAFFPGLSILILGLVCESYSSLVKAKQARFLKSAFGTYLSEKLLDVIIKNPEKLKLGGEKKEVTVLFSDIRGFTSISEKLSPEKLVELLNFYLTPMTEIVLKNEGTLDKYIGDAIMALWNAPLDVEDHPRKALVTAYEMLKKLAEINEEIERRFGFKIDIGVGINTGAVVVGNMGSEKRFDYTAIVDTVNLASRLEGLNKVYSTNILFSEFTWEKVRFDGLEFFPMDVDMVRVKGKEEPVRIFTVLERSEKNLEMARLYEEALSFYRKAMFEKALEVFSKVELGPARTMVMRCRELASSPPERWDGVFVAKTK